MGWRPPLHDTPLDSGTITPGDSATATALASVSIQSDEVAYVQCVATDSDADWSVLVVTSIDGTQWDDDSSPFLEYRFTSADTAFSFTVAGVPFFRIRIRTEGASSPEDASFTVKCRVTESD